MTFILSILLLFTTLDGDGGPVDETCAFLPADHPCHLDDDPPPVCYGPSGQIIVCEGP
jgi:hypothetical protein